MLSQELENWADVFGRYKGTGARFEPDFCALNESVLLDMAEQARALEAAQVSPPARTVEPDRPGSNVVRLTHSNNGDAA